MKMRRLNEIDIERIEKMEKEKKSSEIERFKIGNKKIK